MGKTFNVSGACNPDRHYMVDLRGRLEEIRRMVDSGQYFTINRARQYGKTTMLRALADFLDRDYVVISLDFQNLEYDEFASGSLFVHALAREINRKIQFRKDVPDEIRERLARLADCSRENTRIAQIFECFSEWCGKSSKPVVLMIDEVDTATNNQVFLDFLARLRAYYLDRDETPTFQSVILAGVYDVRSVRRKIRGEDEHKLNSPWNIAADFLVDMSFSAEDIAGMLAGYEEDRQTGMDVEEISRLLYDYTSGYPYLVSRLCKFMDERIADGWTKPGFLEALKILLDEKNVLYESLANKLEDYPELRTVLYGLLFNGKPIPYTAMNKAIEAATMFGFIRNAGGTAVVSNRIFESVLYNLFISEEYADNKIYDVGLLEKNQFFVGGHLDFRRVLEKFVESFDSLYGDREEAFLEDVGRRYFMLFLKPIINGVGNSYVEAETRNRERTDLVVDYRGEQFIVELKIWHGNAYNERGEAQISDYLEYFHLKKGYMLSFNFNKHKEIGVKDIVLGDKLIVEAVV